MRYLPTTINQAELDILKAPYLGGEFALYMTRVAAKLIGEVTMTATGTGSWEANAAVTLPDAGTDLQIACATPLLAASPAVVTFACTDEDDAPVNAVGTFEPPAWSANDSNDFQRGYAVDLLPSVDGKLFKTITSLTTATFAEKNCVFGVWQLPIATDYKFIGCLDGLNWNAKDRMAVGVDCGMESDAFIKRGKSAKGEMTIKHKFKGFGDGIARFGGMKTTVMCLGVKDGQVTSDRVVFTQFVAGNKFDLPEGEGEATAEGGGKYAEVLQFVAPYEP